MKPKKVSLIISYFLVGLFVFNHLVFADTGSSAWINPIWQHVEKEKSLSAFKTPLAPGSSTLCTSYESFKSALNQRFANRSNTFAINLVYDFEFNNVEDIITTACDEIMEENGYTGGNIYSRYVSWSGYNGDVDITFTMEFWTTYEQEQQVTVRVEEIISEIITGLMNEEEKVKAIHDWVVLNVEYDQTLQKHSAYDALFADKETVCQGYTLLAILLLQ